jgi:hypothetical protein
MAPLLEMVPKEHRIRLGEDERQILIAALQPYTRFLIDMREEIDDPRLVEITSTLLERLRRCNPGRPKKPYSHRV